MFLPPNKTSEFNWANCLALARCAALAYESPENFFDRLMHGCDDKANQSRFISSAETDTQCFIVANDDAVVIAFRGTEALKLHDWLTDLDARMVNDQHEGFMKALRSVFTPVLEALQEFAPYPTKKVFVTGHSLGGALAMLLGMRLCHRVDAVYTFGQPRVGNRKFVADYTPVLGAVTYRLVHEEDIVPRVPGVLMGFRHAGQEVFLNCAGFTQFNPPLLDKIASDAWGLWKSWRAREEDVIRDHAMAKYLERIQKCAESDAWLEKTHQKEGTC